MLRVLMYLLPIALTIFALVDCIQTDDEKVRHLPKIGWIVLIVLIWIVGPVAWLIAGRERGHGRPRVSPSTAGPIAPDDDVEFLRQIDEAQRRKKKSDDEPKEG